MYKSSVWEVVCWKCAVQKVATYDSSTDDGTFTEYSTDYLQRFTRAAPDLMDTLAAILDDCRHCRVEFIKPKK